MAEVSGIGLESETPNKALEQLKSDLEGWREVLLPLNKLLQWEKPHYPPVIVGTISFIFLLIWYFEPSVLTIFSLLILIACLIDYLVPTIAATIFGGENWTGVQERQYEQICIRLHNARVHFHDFKAAITNLKEEKPKIYCGLVIGFWMAMAWLGHYVDNLLLTYLTITFIVLVPGLRHHGILQKYLGFLVKAIRDAVQGKAKTS